VTNLTQNWRGLLAGLPLPMLALAASYGVYSFAQLFVPQWVAVIQAAAFELVYIGLAVLIGLDERQRRRAGAISIGAVVVSILYNSLAGLFHRRPELLNALPWWGDAILSVFHGLPLALVAYFVADLLLHRDAETARANDQAADGVSAPTLMWARSGLPDQPVYDAPVEVALNAAPESIDADSQPCPKCGASLDPARWRAARRWGHCKACKGASNE
jgi:hypothetical protein